MRSRSSTGAKAACSRLASAPGCRCPATEGISSITGIDLSPEMLDKARARSSGKKLDNVAGLHEMDAGALAFPDESFDTVVAMYVMTVVPDPEKVMRELERVCAAGRRGDPRQPFQPGGGHPRLRRAAGSRRSRARSAGTCVHARPGPGLRGSAARRAQDALAVWPVHHAPLRQAARLWRGVPQRALRGRVRRQGKALRAVRRAGRSRSGSRIKWQVGRTLVSSRRLLDTRYWRSLYRRLSSQMAE